MDSKLEQKIENMEKSLIRIDKSLIEIKFDLADHIRRTHLLEEDSKSFKKFMWMFIGAGSFIGLLALIATVLVVFI